MTRTKVLIFSLTYFPFVGGAEVAVKEITDRLPNFAFDLITVNLDGRQKKFEKLGNVKVYRLGGGWVAKYFFPWTAYWFAKKLHRQNPYDAVWAIMANQAGMAAAAFKRRFPKVPFLLTLQEGDDLHSWSYRWRLWGPRSFGVFRCPDKVTAISSYLATWARKMGYKGEAEIVPNGVDTGVFSRNFAEQGWSYAPQALVAGSLNYVYLITTSRLVEKNGVDDIIKALSKLPNNFRLVIFGIGHQESNLRKLTQELHLDKRVWFLGHKVHGDIIDYLKRELKEFINVWYIFVRPSRSEGMGNSFIEAMALGIPVIATNVGGISDFLQDKETGLFCKVNDPESVASKVREYVKNPQLTSKVIKKALKLVEQKYTWSQIAARLGRILNHLVVTRH